MKCFKLALALLAVACTSLVLTQTGRVTCVSGTVTIRADGSVDPPTAPITRSGDVYSLTNNIEATIIVERSNIIIDGKGFRVEGNEEGYGFDLSSQSNVTIKNTVITGFAYGVYLNSSMGNFILDNSIFGNVWNAIWLRRSSNNTISENSVSGNYAGIGLFDSSSFNVIFRNDIIGSKNVGIEVYRSSNNTIWSNNFIGNTFQVHTTASSNTWDSGYPTGGNYWSDYSGVDNDHDGIGDTPYVINLNNVDHYPLMNASPIPEFPIFFIVIIFASLSLLHIQCFKKTRKTD